MILNPTVLVLGAGASSPYGYPLGDQLVQRIVELTETGAGLAAPLSGEYDVYEFHRRLQGSDVASIDDFLESNPTLTALGKVCIAASLMVWGPLSYHVPDPNYNWYRYLWRRLHEGASTTEQFRSNRLRIVTYNYDRSLERYLERVLMNSFPDLAEGGEPAAASFLGEVLPIVHLHGLLRGQEEVLRATDRLMFAEREFLEKAGEGIRVVHETEPSAEYAAAHGLLREARAVHLLGFGFHATNVRRLDLVTQAHKSPGWAACGGTAFGLEEAERLRAEAALQLGARILQPVDCLAYLRAHAALA